MPSADDFHASTMANSDDSVIELEPTLVSSDETRPSLFGSYRSVWDQELSTGMLEELMQLLHRRLRSAALFLTATSLAFILFAELLSDSIYGAATNHHLIRLLCSAAVFCLLLIPRKWTLLQLRSLEYFLFGSYVVMVMYSQYTINTRLAEENRIAEMLVFEKNGVMRMMMLMFIYATFIPNKAKVTAGFVLTTALCPIITLVAVLIHERSVVTDLDQLSSVYNLGSNVLFLLMGAGLSIFASHVLNGLRTELHEAKKMGQYQLIEKLGEGGMGQVYLAEHELLKRPCALKLISPEFQANAVALARFEREVQSAAMLSHPNTIEIFDYGRTQDGTFYYVMEYLPGLSIADLVKEAGPLSPGRSVYLLRQVCGSLAEAHRLGLVHRDLKPANILVAILGGQCDVAKVLDFGLVKYVESTEGKQLTAEFTVSGTPAFMAPEQATGMHDVDGRADLYALGSILYFMLTGQPPFEKATHMATMVAHAAEPVIPPSKLRNDVPADLEAVLLRCLAKKAEDRYADARELSAALGACACASDWGQPEAEAWWTAHAERQQWQKDNEERLKSLETVGMTFTATTTST